MKLGEVLIGYGMFIEMDDILNGNYSELMDFFEFLTDEEVQRLDKAGQCVVRHSQGVVDLYTYFSDQLSGLLAQLLLGNDIKSLANKLGEFIDEVAESMQHRLETLKGIAKGP